MYPSGFLRDSSKTSSTSDSVSDVNFSNRAIVLPTKKALTIAPPIKMSAETIISVTPIPSKPWFQTFEIISNNPSIFLKYIFM